MAKRRTAAKTPRPRPSGGGNGDGDDGDWICVGVVTRPKGLRGAVRITAFTARPADVAAYGPPHAGIGGETLDITIREVVGNHVVVAKIAGITDRNGAEALRGKKLYLPREALPEAKKEEFYHVDLIGLRVERADGAAFGTVRAVLDYGGGDILEVAPAGGGETVLLPFTREAVPVVDIAGGRLVVEPPAESDAGPREGDG
jgi:16S rRNA processing protein RimM